jgi:hypothetical protein
MFVRKLRPKLFLKIDPRSCPSWSGSTPTTCRGPSSSRGMSRIGRSASGRRRRAASSIWRPGTDFINPGFGCKFSDNFSSAKFRLAFLQKQKASFFSEHYQKKNLTRLKFGPKRIHQIDPRLQELSETVGSYDRLRHQDQVRKSLRFWIKTKANNAKFWP